MHSKTLVRHRGGRPGAAGLGSPLALPAAGSCTCSKVRGLARQLTGLYDAALAPHGLTVTQYATLATLAHSEAPLTVSALARRLRMDRTTTSRLVGPLEAAGWIGRSAGRAGADARARPLQLTAQGRRVLRAAVPAWRAVQSQVDTLLGRSLKQILHRATENASRALADAAAGSTEDA
jgi:DNA-binding MarR family transcriptional regulator